MTSSRSGAKSGRGIETGGRKETSARTAAITAAAVRVELEADKVRVEVEPDKVRAEVDKVTVDKVRVEAEADKVRVEVDKVRVEVKHLRNPSRRPGTERRGNRPYPRTRVDKVIVAPTLDGASSP